MRIDMFVLVYVQEVNVMLNLIIQNSQRTSHKSLNFIQTQKVKHGAEIAIEDCQV